MYQRDIPHLPIKIDRDQFVEIVFYLGLIHRHGYDTIVASVQLGDTFVSDPKIQLQDTANYEIQSTTICDQSNQVEIMNEPVPRIYSNELAHTVTVIAAKANEDYGYMNIKDAIIDTENSYVLKIEREICVMLNFHVKIHNFITTIGVLLYDKVQHPLLGSEFWDISKQICMDPVLLKMTPRTLILGLIILFRHKKLRASHDNRKRIFTDTMMQISKEYELDLSDVLKEYVSLNPIETRR
jgi:hypothetical protein